MVVVLFVEVASTDGASARNIKVSVLLVLIYLYGKSIPGADVVYVY